MRRLRAQMQHPIGRLGARTVAAHGTASTYWHRAKTTSIRSPARLQRELWCHCGQVARLSWPIELEVCHIEAFACFGLPTFIRQDGTQQSDPILLLTADQQIGIDVARIHDLVFRHETRAGPGPLEEEPSPLHLAALPTVVCTWTINCGMVPAARLRHSGLG